MINGAFFIIGFGIDQYQAYYNVYIWKISLFVICAGRFEILSP